MSAKIIVGIEDDTPIHQALECVLQVVSDGRISETSKGVKHFCWHTHFRNGVHVYTRTKKNNQTSDSFGVYSTKKAYPVDIKVE